MSVERPEIEYSKTLEVTETNIPGLLVLDLPVHGDNRGWFKENWQREKMIALGLPDFGPVQNNISFNAEAGVTRGIHAEPWDKFISTANGSVFGAWVDLRDGPTFGQVFTTIIDASKAIFVPRGVGNAFQALESNTSYTYMVNAHWTQEAVKDYLFLNLADPTANIQWPIPLSECELSDKDKAHPMLTEISPLPNKKALITGANGQLGRALQVLYPDALCVDTDTFDLTDPAAHERFDWSAVDIILNAAAYTNVDGAEVPEGREAAWAVNATALKYLAKAAIKNNIPLVHISTDYVFDGTKAPHSEDENFSPLSVYGNTKAAGDLVVGTVPKHYIARTSWVVGDGNNFVRTMASLAEKGIDPKVVNDQIGRLTFADELAKAIKHLVDTKQPYGTYNVTNSGEVVSWEVIAKAVYELTGNDPARVSGTTTQEYFAGKENIAPRPLLSELNLSKLEATGFAPKDWRQALEEYLKNQ